ncbi:MAG TPA: hypothetical protein VMR52_05100 [Dehalococcoidia bacterium]|nr:hypothetical protein [Dehalococcoidia bacterium]
MLGYAPDESLSDGAAEVATDGFFNSDNEPPWDLWIACVVEPGGREYLVSWIPGELVDTVSTGVEVNPEACIFWLGELEEALGLRS